MKYQTQDGINQNGCRILVIDDNKDAADTLSIMLKMKGNDVQTSYNGYDGVATAESFLPDIVVLDIGMPGIDGFQTCNLIRETDWGKSMVIFALTGYGQPSDFRKSTAAGFDAHLIKPVDFGQLLSLIEGMS